MPKYSAFIYINKLRSEVSVEARDRFEAERFIRAQYGVSGKILVGLDHKAEAVEREAKRRQTEINRRAIENTKTLLKEKFYTNENEESNASHAYINNEESLLGKISEWIIFICVLPISLPFMLVVTIAPYAFFAGLVYIFLPGDIQVIIRHYIFYIYDTFASVLYKIFSF